MDTQIMETRDDTSRRITTLPVLETAQLTLRPWKLDDGPAIDAHFSNYEVAKMTGSKPYPYLPNSGFGVIASQHGKFLRGLCYEFALICKDTQEIAGGCGIFKRKPTSHYELGYWLGQKHWGKGLATEAGNAVLDWAKAALDADTFVAGHFADNPASGRVLTKLGFARVGKENETKPMFSLARGGRSPGLVYIWPASKAATTPLSALH
ncbi:GNAT family N-acetyltransferase [Hirschia litorea]|uniref:GNAT family N-acetyltransferase n=1 Tax=Hirschia litorea TaxID=1199156 RepID=A0ABW2ILW6_9PROT